MKLTDEDFDRRLRNIATLANKQKTGAYSPQFDAPGAFSTIGEALAAASRGEELPPRIAKKYNITQPAPTASPGGEK